MAMTHFLKVYPKPENPHVYTGLFTKPISKRRWSDKPNKITNGVSYTQYADAMRISCGYGWSLFDFIHGKCGYFADYFHENNPDWKVINMMRGSSWGTMIHSYCIKEINGTTYFADARGITDDPETFFNDFTCSKEMYVVDNTQERDTKYDKWCAKAYEYTYGDGLGI